MFFEKNNNQIYQVNQLLQKSKKNMTYIYLAVVKQISQHQQPAYWAAKF